MKNSPFDSFSQVSVKVLNNSCSSPTLIDLFQSEKRRHVGSYIIKFVADFPQRNRTVTSHVKYCEAKVA